MGSKHDQISGQQDLLERRTIVQVLNVNVAEIAVFPQSDLKCSKDTLTGTLCVKSFNSDIIETNM